MKQTILSFLLVLLPLVASADAVEIDGIYYNLVSKLKTAEVTSNPNEYTGNVVIPEKIEYDGIEYVVTSIGEDAFNNDRELTSVSIPKSVTSIGNDAFHNCYGLINVTIPNYVTSIGRYAFYDCRSLTSITIPNSVTSIGDYAFYECRSLTSITIPNSVTSIGYHAFGNCNILTSVHISDLAAWCNTESDAAFSRPYHLYLDEKEIKDLVIPTGVTTIKNDAFLYCSGLRSITIPNSVTTIGSSAFAYCSGLTSVTIPNSVITIGMSAFWGCSGLTSITIPNSVTKIETYTFQNCSGLKTVTISNSVTSIGNSAFSGCSSLTSVSIGSGISSIGSSTFSKCPELTDVYCYSETVPSTNTNVFADSYIDHATLHVPESAIENYKATAPWSSFKNFVSVTDNNNYYDLSITVTNALGKVTYGTTDVTNGLQTFFVKEGSDAVLTLTPNDGFKVDKVMVNGEDRTANVVNGQLTLSNVTANLTVSVSFGVAGEFTKVTIGADKIATFCAAGDVDFTTLNLKAYTGGGFNRQTGVLTMMRVYDVPAGTGLLLKGEPGTYFVPYSQSYSVYSNLLKGVIVATNVNATEDGFVNYVLNNGSQGVGFYKVGTAGASLEAGRAYLQIPAETAMSRSALKLRFDDEDEATAINDVKHQEGETAVYDLQGRRVEQPQRGLYIRNGKKVIIK